MNPLLELLDRAWTALKEAFGDAPAGSPTVPCPAPPPAIPKGCEYLNKGGTVESSKADFDRIRKKATVGPEKAVKHTFRGGSAPVDAIQQTVTVDGRDITVTRPKTAVAPQHLPTMNQIAQSLGAVPSKQLDKFNTVELNDQRNPDDAYWAKEYNDPNFFSAATGGPGGVTFYPTDNAWSQEFTDSTAIHEGGHAYSASIWSDDKVKKQWEAAIKADGRSPSTYADAASTEDFSESLVMYSLSKGTKCEATAKRLFPNRYAALDRLLK